MKTTVSLQSIIDWANYYLFVSESVRFRRLKCLYQQELGDLQEGECLVAYCEIYGSEPEVVAVEDFTHYCNLLDAVQDDHHVLFNVDFFRRPVKHGADASV